MVGLIGEREGLGPKVLVTCLLEPPCFSEVLSDFGFRDFFIPGLRFGRLFPGIFFPSSFMMSFSERTIVLLIPVIARYTDPIISFTLGQLFAPLTARELVRSAGTQSRSAGLKLSRS